jgi:Ser/Thr protein kinase RdoA (MazF antagonist)
MSDSSHPFEQLTPDRIQDALEAEGFLPDGRIMALNSYENRVFQVGLESGGFVIAKFYRPERWSEAAIREEHDFLEALATEEIPVAPMLKNPAGESLFFTDGFRFALSPRIGGRPPEIEDLESLEAIGRLVGRVHAVGKQHPFIYRPTLNAEAYGHHPGQRLLKEGRIPLSILPAYQSALHQALLTIDRAFAAVGSVPHIRLHADAYAGNILETPEGPLLLDFDDARMGPRIQDLWMLAQGETSERRIALMTLIEGYETFETLDPSELRLIEPLRTLRLIHYSDWLSQRTEDPAFEKAFPWFGTDDYWTARTQELLDQIDRMEAPSLQIFL